ncbi:tRNA glutamyl-Q(34) synthetase GluQRS [Devosia sp.]|uniref:tRNA glutamyl-Q(34) synthetase GluQRS n=1 Tax=Devosia sp. TaxID=1871048 RepID=UPI003BA9F051
MTSPQLRFAPSPNGRLHLGHAYSALFTADGAARLGGRFLLRIEDIDLARCKPEFTEAILEDLKWLGLSWPEPVMRQSERFALYAGFGARLKGMNLLYPCFCSRSEIAAAAQGTDPDGAPLYPGTCSHLTDAAVRERLDQGQLPQWRLNSEAAIAFAGLLSYRQAQPTPEQPDVEIAARPERWGDVVLQRRDTPTSYHLSVVVDDEAQGITHVTRGRDMEAATDIHVLLQALLEFSTPVYTFHELLLDDEGRKLAKSRGSQSIADLRAEAWTAEGVRGRLGF